MRRHRNIAKSVPRTRQGATAVEFALIAPLLFLFVLGLVEFSRMMMVKQCLNHAAQVGSRTACLATTQSTSQVDAAVRDALRESIPNASNSSLVRVSVSPSGIASLSTGTSVTVDLDVNLSAVSWAPVGMLSFLGDPTLSAQSTQERE